MPSQYATYELVEVVPYPICALIHSVKKSEEGVERYEMRKSKVEEDELIERGEVWLKPEDQIDYNYGELPECIKMVQDCDLLTEEGLTPEDGNVESSERVFSMIMGPEDLRRVQTKGLGVIPTKYFPNSTIEADSGSESSFSQIIGECVFKWDPNLKSLEEAVQKLDKVSADVTTFLHLLVNVKQEQKEHESDFYKTCETGSLPKNGLIRQG
ncbi:hypothetical protein IEQ34_015868 [Dendrobium chrysotoxum]|uniref:Uncharacterized protein n=1 Tax=Dendrobium chrysotoxum TaxID=161865 RepID=A0AAV7GH16_DENCH|nr:hypothetical protein IEQ34_015868 [Dendrobium chrysotoxum]